MVKVLEGSTTCIIQYNDLEQRNNRVVCVISPNSVTFGAYYVKVVKDTPTHSASKM